VSDECVSARRVALGANQRDNAHEEDEREHGLDPREFRRNAGIRLAAHDPFG
jgi:hypothetical protein